jgi:monovalent cation/hydrogen antiporter
LRLSGARMDGFIAEEQRFLVVEAIRLDLAGGNPLEGKPMIPTIQTLVFLLAVIAAVAFAAKRSKIPRPILLVVTGVVLALIPGLPTIEIAPEFVLLVLLPPIIYTSAVAMSWREFRFSLRAISLLAVGSVLFTTAATAAATHFLLGLAWPVGFVLGAIVSPPDPVAPLAIARRLRVPRRLLVILEGEGLANDATALVLYRFAVTAVSAGVFHFEQVLGSFVLIVAGEILWGIGVGWLMLRLRRWVGDPSIELTLSVLTPFLAYWPPQHVGGSGVLATITAGLYMSWNGLRLISAATRLQGIFFWDFLNYLIDGMLFLVTGLQARAVISGIHGYSMSDLAISAALVSAVVITARFVWVYPSTYLPRWLVPGIRRKDPSPTWQWPFALASAGVRGVVSLAAALAIPFTTSAGEPFPHRDLILFLTFVVILVTLVGQGLLLPSIIRLLGLADAGRRELRDSRTEERKALRQAVAAAIERFEQLAVERSLSDDVAKVLRARQHARLLHHELTGDEIEDRSEFAEIYAGIEHQLIEAERKLINDLYRDGELKDEPRRRIERDLDLREARLANERDEE